ncbi:MAG: flavin reductase family protein [Deltaproteobacteria bacterium]|nr:flavin reductase family protein [Deltaproteobacteria bacterium]
MGAPQEPAGDLAALFKQAMSSFPSGVTALTTLDPQGAPVGMTASAFISVSLRPPLVLESVAKTAQMHAHLTREPRYAVSVLSATQVDESDHFAGWGRAGFTPAWGALAGLPTVLGSVARLACRVVSRVDAGDHTLFIGEVEAVEVEEGAPLVYARRGYHGLRPL